MRVFTALETERAQVVAQVAKWLFHKETGQIPGPVRHHFTLADADKQIVVFLFQLRQITLRAAAASCAMASTKFISSSSAPAQVLHMIQQCLVGRCAQQGRQQRIGRAR